MKVICSSEESLYRPEAVRWRQRMELMKPIGESVVLLPCSMKKPYSNSKSHQAFRKVTRSFQELIVTSPFGICPRELENTFPIQSYDVSTTGSWSQDEIMESGRLIEKYCEGKNVIAHLAGGYLEACEAFLDDFTLTCKNGKPTSPDSIYNLRMELKNHNKINRREKVLNELRSIAIYQFGPKAKDFIPDNVKAKGRYHKKIIVDGTQIALLNKDHGLYRLNLAGGEILKNLGINIVNIDFNLETNTVFAPGINKADHNIIPNDEVVVVKDDTVVGVGKAILTGREMEQCSNGIGVKIKHRLK
ncbi:MAG: pseudouridine synthase [Methanobrevibacter millerae]|uniref:Pseudouridine synthase n=1 Tax=Methanobrevibacter millerae TaxID=230361 RepID=A0A8T3VMQ2_9EURY|nr:pseudouridine synthase [Methanobrevibacter millerae]